MICFIFKYFLPSIGLKITNVIFLLNRKILVETENAKLSI